MRKKLLLSVMCAMFSVAAVYSQAFDVPENAQLVAGSGQSKLIIPNVKGVTGNFTVAINSGSTYLNGTPTVEYTAGQNFALLVVTEKGVEGTASVKVTAGGVDKTFDVKVVAFSNAGIEVSIYDAVFWQKVDVIQTSASPVFQGVLTDEAHVPTEQNSLTNPASFWYGKWEDIYPKFTAGNICEGTYCNPEPLINLGTSALKGFFIPKVSGKYSFSLHTPGGNFMGLVALDTECVSWKNAKEIIRTHGEDGVMTGTAEDNTRSRINSAEFDLDAGKAYPIYAIYWFIHGIEFDIAYKGPGVTTWTIIPASLLSPLYDVAKPATPTDVKIHTTMNEKVLLEWNAALSGTKVAKVKGYNVYANGKKNNTALVTETTFLLTGLTAGTDYDIFVTSVDELGNESLISNVERTKTMSSSTTPPEKPTDLYAEAKTGEVLKMRWNKPAGIVAYDIDVDGVKYNTDYIYTDSFFIRKLKPNTEYTIRVRGYNGSLTASGWSDGVQVTTTAFDPEAEQLPGFNEYRVRLEFDMKNISWTQGVGINTQGKDKPMINDAGYKEAITAYKPGIVRWGGLDANEYGFQKAYTGSAGDFATSIGSTRKNKGLTTHAQFMDYCNEIGAYYSLCVGTKEGLGGLGSEPAGDYTVDYMDPENGYKVFQGIIEYLAGPAGKTALGAVRSMEGYPEPLLAKGKSKGLIIEFGNEVWGSKSHNAQIGADYDKYGKWCRAMADSMRKSPYWDEVKDLVQFAYSGRDPAVSTTNDNAVRGTAPGQVQILALSGYLGGNLDYNPDVDYGQTVNHYYRLRINQVAQNLSGMQAVMRKQIQMTGAPLNTYFYETQVSTESYFGYLGQATVLLDYITSSMKYGGMVPSIFIYGGGQWMINDNDKPLAHYHMARLVNTYCKGHLLKSRVVTNNQLMVDASKLNDFVPIANFDPVGASVYNNGKNWSILLFSRDFDNEYSVQIKLPEGVGEIKNAKRHIVTGDGSENGPSIRLGFGLTENETVTLKDGDIVYVPPFSMVLYSFEANDPGFEALPLGHFERVLPTGITFSGTPAITTNAGTTKITAIISPSNVFTTDVIWEISEKINKEIVDASLPFPVLSVAVSTATLRATSGSGANATKACNGSFWLTATAADNPAVSGSIEITLSNQNSGCEYPIIGVDGAETEATVSVYPNPAEEALFVDTNTDALSTVTIYSSIGIRVMAETGSEQVIELNVASLPAGQYTAVVESNGKAETVTFLKK